MTVEIHGADQLERLSRRLKEAGRTELSKELNKSIRDAMKPVREDVKQTAEEILPHAGGLNALVAGSPLRLDRRNFGVRLVMASKSNIRRINRGLVRHPVYGHAVWVTQRLRPGFFDKPTEAAAGKVRAEIMAAMNRIIRKI